MCGTRPSLSSQDWDQHNKKLFGSEPDWNLAKQVFVKFPVILSEFHGKSYHLLTEFIKIGLIKLTNSEEFLSRP